MGWGWSGVTHNELIPILILLLFLGGRHMSGAAIYVIPSFSIGNVDSVSK